MVLEEPVAVLAPHRPRLRLQQDAFFPAKLQDASGTAAVAVVLKESVKSGMVIDREGRGQIRGFFDNLGGTRA